MPRLYSLLSHSKLKRSQNPSHHKHLIYLMKWMAGKLAIKTCFSIKTNQLQLIHPWDPKDQRIKEMPCSKVGRENSKFVQNHKTLQCILVDSISIDENAVPVYAANWKLYRDGLDVLFSSPWFTYCKWSWQSECEWSPGDNGIRIVSHDLEWQQL